MPLIPESAMRAAWAKQVAETPPPEHFTDRTKESGGAFNAGSRGRSATGAPLAKERPRVNSNSSASETPWKSASQARAGTAGEVYPFASPATRPLFWRRGARAVLFFSDFEERDRVIDAALRELKLNWLRVHLENLTGNLWRMEWLA